MFLHNHDGERVTLERVRLDTSLSYLVITLCPDLSLQFSRDLQIFHICYWPLPDGNLLYSSIFEHGEFDFSSAEINTRLSIE